MTTRSYHHSKEKHNHRLFKLKWAKRSIRTAPRIWLPEKENWMIYTLCGASVWLESQLVEFIANRDMKTCSVDRATALEAISVESFNTTAYEFDAALHAHSQLPADIRPSINLSPCRLTAKKIAVDSDFTDFDTCAFFFKKVADATLALCEKSRMLALTVIVSGRHTAKDWILLPDGMSYDDAKNPEEIAVWIAERTNMECVDYDVYRNAAGTATMATIIFKRIEKVPQYAVAGVRSMLRKGMTCAEICENTRFPLNSVRAIKARMHKSFAKKR